MFKQEKECETGVRDWILRLQQSFFDKLPYSRSLNFLKNNKLGHNVKFGNHNTINDCLIGSNVRIYNCNTFYHCQIGDGTTIGSNCIIQGGVKVGKNCKIGDGVFIPSGVEIDDFCFIAAGTKFSNDLWPAAVNDNNELKEDKDWALLETRIGKHNNFGINCSILPGLIIGERNTFGAGCVLTKSVDCDGVFVGCPARKISNKIHENHTTL